MDALTPVSTTSPCLRRITTSQQGSVRPAFPEQPSQRRTQPREAGSAQEAPANCVMASKTSGGDKKGNKTKCPISKKDFLAKAKPVLAQIEGQPVAVSVKEFSTGSFGFYSQGKITLVIDGTPVTCQCAISIQVVGSKEAE